jgi:hypothetical protein
MFDLRELIWRDEGELEKHLNAITSIESNEEFEVTMNIIKIGRVQGRMGAWQLHNRKLLALRNALQRVCFLAVRKLLSLALHILLVCDNAIRLSEHLRNKLSESGRKIRALQLDVCAVKTNLNPARLRSGCIQLKEYPLNLWRYARISAERSPMWRAVLAIYTRYFHRGVRMRANDQAQRPPPETPGRL